MTKLDAETLRNIVVVPLLGDGQQYKENLWHRLGFCSMEGAPLLQNDTGAKEAPNFFVSSDDRKRVKLQIGPIEDTAPKYSLWPTNVSLNI
ncbi:hypothetical protein PsorP6_002702 [Peronosclerospora sorghi]|uniref:Uncharacterized protein n=1 Tax=Peronosclerospora sorghi TaxID=230839 RepID=A0ACC0WS88_9STRA|nr:hypothetical protein PsorP6_002702 [Peronosclerospora sorghi]